MKTKISKEYIDFVEQEHKTQLTSFDVLVPPKLTITKKKPIEKFEHPDGLMFWNCYQWKDIKYDPYLFDAYQKLMTNFRRESNYFDDSKGFSFLWLLFCSTLSKGVKITGDFFPIGMLGIVELEDQFGYPSFTAAWIHPYLRGQKVMQMLLAHLYTKKFHLIDPPVSNSMTFAISASQELLSNEVMERNKKSAIEYTEKRYNVTLTGLSDIELAQVMNLLPFLKEGVDIQKYVDYVVSALRNENIIEELKKLDLSGLDEKTFLKERNKAHNEMLTLKAIGKMVKPLPKKPLGA